MRFQSPSILGWSISGTPFQHPKRFRFSPLRYWGGLYHLSGFKNPSFRFSPLRYQGGLYQIVVSLQIKLKVLVPFDIGVVYIRVDYKDTDRNVLVPFDIGVVYIKIACINRNYIVFQSPSILGWSISERKYSRRFRKGFSPLRYWGGLYLKEEQTEQSDCFSPLRYWGGLYHKAL